MANLGSIEDTPSTPLTGTTTAAANMANLACQEPVSAFIISPNVQSKHDGYLLYLQLPKPSKQIPTYKWTGDTTSLYASIPVRNSLFKHKSSMNSSSTSSSSSSSSTAAAKLILVTPKQSILNEKRIEIKLKLKNTITLVKEKTSFHPNIEESIDELIESITALRKDSIDSIKSIERDLKMSVVDPIMDTTSLSQPQHGPGIDQRYLSELWRVSYNFGIDLQNECLKFMTEDKAKQFANCLADFCIMWCEYIVNKTEKGRGRTCKLNKKILNFP